MSEYIGWIAFAAGGAMLMVAYALLMYSRRILDEAKVILHQAADDLDAEQSEKDSAQEK